MGHAAVGTVLAQACFRLSVAAAAPDSSGGLTSETQQHRGGPQGPPSN